MSHSQVRGVDAEPKSILVRYWASAKAASGTAQDVLDVTGPIALAEVVRRILERHADTRLEAVLGACSTLIGDEPAGTRPAEEVVVHPGQTVEFLPPFAGG
ncbi:MoaD/ThiS family protein [Nocardioides insulae]|uniref:MoaD/ThiS family protein n=1 Tax=Nocardioides insulae TaxID=394734 RepID=UPI0004176EE8|nr:thiamine biosynthesis protein ThiS [Nocardioides insulae]